MRRSIWPVAAVLAIAALSACSAPGAPGTPGDQSEWVTATPATDLVGGQEVTVAGGGYSANAPVGVIQCKAPAEDYGDCSSQTARSFSADSSGRFRLQHEATRILRFGNGREHDCGIPDSCFFVTVYPHGFQGRAVASLEFRPGPAVSAWPDAKLTDQQEIQVKGYGYSPNSSLGIVQCPAGATAIDQCDGRTATSFSADADGNYTRQMTVYKIIEDAHRVKTDCSVRGSCVVASVYIHGFAGLATHDLTFQPDG